MINKIKMIEKLFDMACIWVEEGRYCGTHLLCGLPLCTNVDPQCTSLYLVRLAVLRTVGWLNFVRCPVIQVSSASCLHTRPDVYFPLFCTTHGTQDSRLSRNTVIHQLYKCRVPIAFIRQVSITAQCILQESIHVAALMFMHAHVLLSHANAMMSCELAQGVTVQCLVPPRQSMWTIFGIFMHPYYDSEQTICIMLETNGVQCS